MDWKRLERKSEEGLFLRGGAETIQICGDDMETVKLTDICTPKQWKTIPIDQLLDEGYPVYGANGVIGYFSEYNHENSVIAITCRGATCGSINITCPKAYVTGNAMCLDDIRKDINVEYLYYCLKHFDFSCVISGSAQPQITRQSLDKVFINICEGDEQKEIVKQLKKIEIIIELKSKQLKALDNLIKARFVEMFGDLGINPYNWPMVTIGTVIKSCQSGWSGNGTQRLKRDGEMAVLKVSAVTKGYFIPEECKVLDDQVSIKKYVFPEKGDLLFSRANTREMVGATAVISQNYPELILPDKLWKIRFIDTVNVHYMKYILSSPAVRARFSAVSTGTSGSMYNVSMDKFKMIQIPIPPWEIQNQFADFVAQTDKSKAAIQKSLEETQVLFDSLMQKYFG